MAVVRDILARKGTEVVTAAPEDSVLEAAQRMNARGIGALPVLQDGRLAGIFTERDLMRRVVAEARSPSGTTIREVMTSRLVSATPETSVEECGALMTAQRIRHLPVLGPDGALLGIVTIGDLLAYQLAEQAITIAQLNSYVYENR
jgi:CBS domain-containing protein